MLLQFIDIQFLIIHYQLPTWFVSWVYIICSNC